MGLLSQCPAIVISLLFGILAIPNLDEKLIEKEELKRVDTIGSLLSLAWPTMPVFALQEAVSNARGRAM